MNEAGRRRNEGREALVEAGVSRNSGRGLTVPRYFTTPDVDPFAAVEWDTAAR